jgi:outer membrane protein assembly factor BamB
MSRNSPQTAVSKDNVAQLKVKWSFNTGATVEDSLLIVGSTDYVIKNNFQVLAFDMDTELNKWKYDPKVESPWGAHGLSYDNGTVVALNANNEEKIWNLVLYRSWEVLLYLLHPLSSGIIM